MLVGAIARTVDQGVEVTRGAELGHFCASGSVFLVLVRSRADAVHVLQPMGASSRALSRGPGISVLPHEPQLADSAPSSPCSGSTIIAVFPHGSVQFDDDLLKSSRDRIETVVRVRPRLALSCALSLLRLELTSIILARRRASRSGALCSVRAAQLSRSLCSLARTSSPAHPRQRRLASETLRPAAPASIDSR